MIVRTCGYGNTFSAPCYRYLVGNDSRVANVQILLSYLQAAKLGKQSRPGRPSKMAQTDSRARRS